MNKLQSTLIVEGSRYGSRILGNQQVVKFKSLKTSTSTFSSSSSSNQQIFNFKSNTNNHIGSSSSSLSSNNRVLYSTTITPPPPPLFNPTPPPTINNDDQQQDDEKQQQQQQNKKKNYSKYLLLGTAAGSVIVPLWYLLVDNDSLAPTLPHSPLDASQHGILLSQTINVEKIYASHSSSDLLFSYFILKLCTIPFLSENGSHMIELAQKYGLTKPMYWIVKQTFFKHFCAGEVIEETPKVADKLHQQGVGVVLDYSVEDQAGTSEAFDHVAAQIIQTVHVSTKTPSLSFSCVKVTGLTNPELLEKLNTIAQKCGVQQVTDVAYLKDPKLLYTNPSLVAATSAALSPRELKELSELVERLDSIFRVCHAQGIPILIDAEQTYYQHCIHHLAMSFAYKYNTDKPLVYNTYQMYLVNGMDTLNEHMQVAQQNGFKLGAKLVRGAYMNSERARAQKLNYADPILPNIQETHHAYFTAMERLLNEFAKNPSQLGVMVASHNEQSISYGAERVKQLGIDGKSPNLQFGQLYGMGDYLTLGLVNRDLRVFKYVPYGPVKDVLPYLVRRMQENKGFIGSNSATELAFLKKEIQRRFKSLFQF